ncbi:DNA-processing protein DprA [Caminibacter mediatlanticus TB-2]|uniref:DNA-processing protein DprA n=1 Tax=Caminibacter mediatlanticus TB-2 TaxID=391592 RepID=A0ABX5V9Q3_9BACT|nr:DNA-processing protein DprA [Caminibacter mediatlanticus]QCT95020.1 DNA-processing protein DprA [Caminibacter mediatlanticus TB-2]
MNSIKIDEFKLFYKGNLELLNKPKVAIVGSRKASKYTKEITFLLAKKLSKKFTIISGGALGVDTEAHKSAFPNTIFVSPSSLDIIYPKSNENLIKNIYKEGLGLSEYEKNYKPYKFTFLQRNRIIIKLADFVIITEADINSGTMRSFEWAKKFGKKVYVIPHRLNESKGTQYLAKENLAEVIWDIDKFCKSLGINEENRVLTLQEALKKYGDKLYEMEILKEVEIKNGKVYFNSSI